VRGIKEKRKRRERKRENCDQESTMEVEEDCRRRENAPTLEFHG
jgi:hypothetical protein